MLSVPATSMRTTSFSSISINLCSRCLHCHLGGNPKKSSEEIICVMTREILLRSVCSCSIPHDLRARDVMFLLLEPVTSLVRVLLNKPNLKKKKKDEENVKKKVVTRVRDSNVFFYLADETLRRGESEQPVTYAWA